MTFRDTVTRAANRYLRGHIQWTTAVAVKIRGGSYYSEYTQHECKDAILRQVTEKTVEITLPDGQTFRKQKASHGFNLHKVRPITPRSYQILLKKRSHDPAPPSDRPPSIAEHPVQSGNR